MKEIPRDVVNGVKRLTRMGNKDNTTAQKIIQACVSVSEYIAENNLLDHFPDYEVYHKTLIDPKGRIIDGKMGIDTAIDFSIDIYKSKISEVILYVDGRE